MLEIIILIFISKKIGALALAKGQSKNAWVTASVILFFICEIIGLTIGFVVFDKRDLLPAALIGYGVAFTSYYILRFMLNNRPDVENIEQMIDNIGAEEKGVI